MNTQFSFRRAVAQSLLFALLATALLCAVALIHENAVAGERPEQPFPVVNDVSFTGTFIRVNAILDGGPHYIDFVMYEDGSIGRFLSDGDGEELGYLVEWVEWAANQGGQCYRPDLHPQPLYVPSTGGLGRATTYMYVMAIASEWRQDVGVELDGDWCQVYMPVQIK